MNFRRTLPLPFREKSIEVRKVQSSENRWINCALDVETKIIRRLEKIGSQFAVLAAHAHVAQQRSLAIPRKIRAQIGQWKRPISEIADLRMSENFQARFAFAKIGGAGNLN